MAVEVGTPVYNADAETIDVEVYGGMSGLNTVVRFFLDDMEVANTDISSTERRMESIAVNRVYAGRTVQFRASAGNVDVQVAPVTIPASPESSLRQADENFRAKDVAHDQADAALDGRTDALEAKGGTHDSAIAALDGRADALEVKARRYEFDSGWNSLPLIDVVPFDATPEWRRVGKVLFLRGTVKAKGGGQMGNGHQICRITAERAGMYYPVAVQAYGGPAIGRLRHGPAGVLMYQDFPDMKAEWVSLDGLVFPAVDETS